MIGKASGHFEPVQDTPQVQPSSLRHGRRFASNALLVYLRRMSEHNQPSIETGPNREIHPEAAQAVGYLANHAARAFNRLVDAQLRSHGLTLALIGPLLLLKWKGEMLQRDLVRLSAVKQPAMVALLDKLEAAGMVSRTTSLKDKRAATVHLTDKGNDAATLGRRVLLDVNAHGAVGFSDAEQDLLVTLLTRLILNFEQTMEHNITRDVFMREGDIDGPSHTRNRR